MSEPAPYPKREGSHIGERVFIGGNPGREYKWTEDGWVITEEWFFKEIKPDE